MFFVLYVEDWTLKTSITILHSHIFSYALCESQKYVFILYAFLLRLGESARQDVKSCLADSPTLTLTQKHFVATVVCSST